VLSAALEVTVTGVDQKRAEELVASAHKICPYSNAIRGNVDVGITVSAHEQKAALTKPPGA
jgi:osmotically inducible protein OsmC